MRLASMSCRQAYKLTLLILFISAGLSPAKVGSEEIAPPDNSAHAEKSAGHLHETTGDAQHNSENAVFKAEIQKINLSLESLKEIALDIKRLREAAGDLYDEVSIKPIDYTMPPNVVGFTVISLPVHINNSAMLAPRSKWVTQCMKDVEPVIKLLKQDVDAVSSGEKTIQLPDAVRDEMQPLLKDWAATVSNLDHYLANLKPYTSAPPYDNNAIAGLAGQIQKNARSLERTRKKMYKLLQKEATARH